MGAARRENASRAPAKLLVTYIVEKASSLRSLAP